MKKIYVILSLILFLGGCMSSPARRYYQLHLTEAEVPISKTINRAILIEPIEVDDLYDDYRIVYRISPFELNYYSYEFWADKPAKLLRDSITHYFLKNNVFQKVIQEISMGEPDILWKSKIHSVEEIDSQDIWYARLAMEVELVDFKSKERLYFYQFDRKEKLATKSVALVPVILSKILEEELNIIIRDILEKME
jgi:ABC-type uncharacterized transport system auxiliary subunit